MKVIVYFTSKTYQSFFIRDVFAPISFRQRMEAFSAYEFDIQNEDGNKEEEGGNRRSLLIPTTTTTSALFANETNQTITTKIQQTTKRIEMEKIWKKREFHRIPFAAFLYNFATKS